MSESDARFEDATEGPLRLQALDSEDLLSVSTLLQDSILTLGEMTWQPAKRRLGFLVNRFRWEDKDDASKQNRAFERVQAMIVVNDVSAISSMGLKMADKEQILSLLSVEFEAQDAPAGKVVFTFAGDGAVACAVECLDLTLTDVTRPYGAPSGLSPSHDV